MLRTVGPIARYAACGGAGAAAYDCATNDGSMLGQVIKQLVASAAQPREGGLAFPQLDYGAALQRAELAELSAKLDRLTSIGLSGIFGRGSRASTSALVCAAGVVFGGLAVWAIATGRWWPTVLAKLELVELAIGAVDAKVDARADATSAQLVQQHEQVLCAVGTVSASVSALDDKFCRLERRVVQMDETGQENNQGIKILCEVVASNFDLRSCPAPVLKRLHEFSGTGGELVENLSAVRTVQAPAAVRLPSAPTTLMGYLTSPGSTHQAAC
ncbi:hypothetical protein T492DRAFT_1028507 [Pavlovales sp. CCMP2436]|nr:hypothetical protein T492DRAFT_1028507 [Pavlovales sp. CCMP2436]|mmetsp:Transcript_4945/g.12401  ORF Transcript_4945/g.12401 Transcript_4945/m.12401 type:complete len:272 (+) Transcript_4945:63-878(+)